MPINKALAEYLELYHKGEANAVTSRELECAFRMRGSELRREINACGATASPSAALTAATTMPPPRRSCGAPSAAPQPDQENRICGAQPVPHPA